MKVKDKNNQKVYETIIDNHHVMISKKCIDMAKEDYGIDLLEMTKKYIIEKEDKNDEGN